MYRIKMVPEDEQHYRTRDEICRDFPEVSIALKNPDEIATPYTGGIVVAYSDSDILESESDLSIFAHKNGYVFSDTITEKGALLLW